MGRRGRMRREPPSCGNGTARARHPMAWRHPCTSAQGPRSQRHRWCEGIGGGGEEPGGGADCSFAVAASATPRRRRRRPHHPKECARAAAIAAAVRRGAHAAMATRSPREGLRDGPAPRRPPAGARRLWHGALRGSARARDAGACARTGAATKPAARDKMAEMGESD